MLWLWDLSLSLTRRVMCNVCLSVSTKFKAKRLQKAFQINLPFYSTLLCTKIFPMSHLMDIWLSGSTSTLMRTEDMDSPGRISEFQPIKLHCIELLPEVKNLAVESSRYSSILSFCSLYSL